MTNEELNERFAKSKGDMNEGLAKSRTYSLEVKVEIPSWIFGLFNATKLGILGLYLIKSYQLPNYKYEL